MYKITSIAVSRKTKANHSNRQDLFSSNTSENRKMKTPLRSLSKERDRHKLIKMRQSESQ